MIQTGGRPEQERTGPWRLSWFLHSEVLWDILGRNFDFRVCVNWGEVGLEDPTQSKQPNQEIGCYV